MLVRPQGCSLNLFTKQPKPFLPPLFPPIIKEIPPQATEPGDTGTLRLLCTDLACMFHGRLTFPAISMSPGVWVPIIVDKVREHSIKYPGILSKTKNRPASLIHTQHKPHSTSHICPICLNILLALQTLPALGPSLLAPQELIKYQPNTLLLPIYLQPDCSTIPSHSLQVLTCSDYCFCKCFHSYQMM